MKKLILSSITILLSIPCFSQSITGTISYDNEKVPNALIYNKNSEELPVYSDTNGYFEIKNTKPNDTLVIKSKGFKNKEIPLLNSSKSLQIELEQASTVLNEIIIQTINSEWKYLYKRAKANHWMSVNRNLENINIITTFTAKEDIKCNGLAFYAKKETDLAISNKLRPLFFKQSITPENSLILSEAKVFTIPIKNKYEYKIEFVFDYIIEIKKGDIVYIGLQQLTEDDHNNHTHNSITLAPVKKFEHTDLSTYVVTDLFNNDTMNQVPISDLYFELKSVK